MEAEEFIKLSASEIKEYMESLNISFQLLKYPHLGITRMGNDLNRKVRKFPITWKHRILSVGGYMDSIKVNGITMIDIAYHINLTSELHVECVLKYDHTIHMFHQSDSYYDRH